MEAGAELPETSANEIARICWKWFSSDRIFFRGRVYLRDERVSKFPQRVHRYNWGWAGFKLRTPCSLDRTGSSTDGCWAHLDSTIPR